MLLGCLIVGIMAQNDTSWIADSVIEGGDKSFFDKRRDSPFVDHREKKQGYRPAFSRQHAREPRYHYKEESYDYPKQDRNRGKNILKNERSHKKRDKRPVLNKRDAKLSLEKMLRRLSKKLGRDVTNKNWQYTLTDKNNNGKMEMNFFYTDKKKPNVKPHDLKRDFELVKQTPVWKNPRAYNKLKDEMNSMSFNTDIDKKKYRSSDKKRLGNFDKMAIGDAMRSY